MRTYAEYNHDRSAQENIAEGLFAIAKALERIGMNGACPGKSDDQRGCLEKIAVEMSHRRFSDSKEE
ncbi:MAG: hypothetical protein WC824_09790 [Bacteroidota bacterium]|jgi:hypothetical protein